MAPINNQKVRQNILDAPSLQRFGQENTDFPNPVPPNLLRDYSIPVESA